MSGRPQGWLSLAGLSWRELGRRTWRESRQDNVINRAAELAFWFLLGFFPMLLFVTSVGTSLALSPGAQGSLMKYIGSLLPNDAASLVRKVLAQTSNGGGGSKEWISLLIALWSASSATAGLIDGLHAIYDLKETRPWWKMQIISIVLAVAIGVFTTAALIAVVYGPALLRHAAGGSWLITAWNALQWPAAAALLVVGLLVVYRYAPNVREQKWKWLVPGSIMAAAIWIAVSFLFRLYVTHFSNFGLMYGSIGALVILMFWFYLSGVAILVGGEINSILEDSAAHRRVPGAKKYGQDSAEEPST